MFATFLVLTEVLINIRDETKLVKVRIRRMRISSYKFVWMRIWMQMLL